ncbi:tubulin-specific chaperone A [Mortierella sp. GBAus27b]|nr:hypothetical protein BGX31_008622 [Mortierella sp. GBA43]KAI8362128.1 tubulin-specific chaperone A [Mortierella sp. GBAus27b]
MSTKDLTIKTKVLQRLLKEHTFYLKEQEKQQKHIDTMVQDKKDDYDIKKQREVLEETVSMLPDVERRIKSARFDLETLVANASDDLKQTTEYTSAVNELESLAK